MNVDKREQKAAFCSLANTVFTKDILNFEKEINETLTVLNNATPRTCYVKRRRTGSFLPWSVSLDDE